MKKMKFLMLISFIIIAAVMLSATVFAADIVARVTDPENTTTNYDTFAKAVAAVNSASETGDYTITLLKSTDENITINQRKDVNVTITAANKKDIEYSGSIIINGGSKASKITISNIKFNGSNHTDDYKAINMDSAKHHIYNVTIIGCDFVDDDNSLTAIKSRQDYKIFISNCTQKGGYQFFWARNNSEQATVENVDVSGVKEGINAYGTPITLKNSNISASDFAIRFNMEANANYYVNNCTLTAKTPVVVRVEEKGDTIKATATIENSTLIIAPDGTEAIGTATEEAKKIENPLSVVTLKNVTIRFKTDEEKEDEKAPVIIIVDVNGDKMEITSDSAMTIGDIPVPERNGYKFVGWYTANVGGEKVDADTVIDKDMTIFARWTKIVADEKKDEKPVTLSSNLMSALGNASRRLAVTTTANDGGRVSNSRMLAYGSNFTCIFIPNAGYKIASVTIDGEDMGDITSYTFKNIKTNHSVEVEFEKIS